MGAEVNDAVIGYTAKTLATYLHDLEAIAERVLDKEAPLTLNLIIRTRSVAGVSTSGSDSIDILHVERDMRLLRRAEVRIDPEVQLSIAELEPDSAPGRKGRRLRYLAQAEHLAIEAARLVLEAAGHRHLYVINAQNGHALSSDAQAAALACSFHRRAFTPMASSQTVSAVSPRMPGATLYGDS
jgi:hypothetical protein